MAKRVVDDASLITVAEAIRGKTGTTEALAFPNAFSEAIDALHTFVPTSAEVLDPDEVYRTTRPKNWLPMPVPGDNEIYLLGQLMPGVTGYFAATLQFAGNCLVEFGTVRDGAFIAQESMTPISDIQFYKELLYDDYGDALDNGRHQYMVRISGSNITRFIGRRLGLNIPAVLIVDAVCGIALSRFCVGDHNNNKSKMSSLRYLRFVGNGRPGWLNTEFVQGCESLLSVSCEIPNPSDYASYSLTGCKVLIAVSPNLFAGVKTGAISHAFNGCGISALKLGGTPTDVTFAFRDSALRRFSTDTCNTSKTTNFSGTFMYCGTLTEVELDITSMNTASDIFYACWELSRLVFVSEVTPGGFTINLTQTSLGHDALVEMIDSLPAATAPATITITGTPGAAALSEAEIAVATEKNWTITI